MSNLRSKHPYEFFTRGNQIRANVESVKRKRWDYETAYTADSFVLPGAVQDWIDTEFAQEVSLYQYKLCPAASTRRARASRHLTPAIRRRARHFHN